MVVVEDNSVSVVEDSAAAGILWVRLVVGAVKGSSGKGAVEFSAVQANVANSAMLKFAASIKRKTNILRSNGLSQISGFYPYFF